MKKTSLILDITHSNGIIRMSGYISQNGLAVDIPQEEIIKSIELILKNRKDVNKYQLDLDISDKKIKIGK